MKKLATLLLTLCLLLPAFALGETYVPEAGAEITLMGGAHLISVTEIVMKDFIAAHPEIKINFEKYSYAEYPTKMKIQLSTGEATPDILLVHDVFIQQFVEAGYLSDLSGMISADEYLPVFGNVTKDGAVYGLPNQCSIQYVFLYRKDVYAKLGLTPPATFEEYFQQALTLKENGYYAGALDPVDGCDGIFRNFLNMLGGTELAADGTISFDKGVEALTLLKQCYDAGIWHVSNQGGSDAYWSAFNAGQIAAFPAVASNAAYYETNCDPQSEAYGNLGIATAFTFGEDCPKSFIGNVEYFAINKNTRYPEASKLVLSYLCQNADTTEKFSNVNENGVMAKYVNGYLPGLNRVAENGSAGWASFGGEQVVSFLARNLLETKASVPLVDTRTAEIRAIEGEVIGEMLLNGVFTPETAIQEMLDRCDLI